MRKWVLCLLGCVMLAALATVFVWDGWPSDRPLANTLPEGDRLDEYNRAVTEVEREEELEN